MVKLNNIIKCFIFSLYTDQVNSFPVKYRICTTDLYYDMKDILYGEIIISIEDNMRKL
jgi:hypothetical protein